MATKGYEPYRVLYHLFHQSADRPLTEAEQFQIGGIVSQVTENRSYPDGSSLVVRFMDLMAEKNGVELPAEDSGLVEGLLQCLTAYQKGSPYTRTQGWAWETEGIWDHFKGGVYLKTGHGGWASGDGELVVEYRSMLFGTKHYRFATQWCEVVQWPDGKYRSRFVYRGPDLKTPEPDFKVPSPTTPAH